MESEEEQDRNDSSFTQQLWYLFDALESWDAQHAAFELEVIARSPSDDKHPRSGEGGEARFEGSSLDLNYYPVPELKGRTACLEVHVITKLCVLRRMQRGIAPRVAADRVQPPDAPRSPCRAVESTDTRIRMR